jgi:hypothetical protein
MFSVSMRPMVLANYHLRSSGEVCARVTGLGCLLKSRFLRSRPG